MKQINIDFLLHKESELDDLIKNHLDEFFMELHEITGVGFESGMGVVTDHYKMDYSDDSYNPFYTGYSFVHNKPKNTLHFYLNRYTHFSNGRNLLNALIYHLMYKCEQDINRLEIINSKCPFRDATINIKPNIKLLSKNIGTLNSCYKKYSDKPINDKLFNSILLELYKGNINKTTTHNTRDYKIHIAEDGKIEYKEKIFLKVFKTIFN